MELMRTLLFVPGHKDRLLEKAPTFGADGLLYDLEDSVPAPERSAARAKIATQLSQVVDIPRYVRINGLADAGPDVVVEDLAAIVVPGLDGIMLPKANGADDIAFVVGQLAKLESKQGLPEGSIEIIPFIESAKGIHFAYEIALASPRVVAMGIGSAEDGDLMNDLQCRWSPEGTELLYARSRLLLEARAAGVQYLIDGVFLGLEDEAGLVRDAEIARTLGYCGKTVIHPKQIAPINRVFSPSQKEIDYYRAMIEAFEVAEQQGTGAISFRGKMIDRAMVRKARRILSRGGASAR